MLLSQIAPGEEVRILIDKATLFVLNATFLNLWPRFQELRLEYSKQWHFPSADVLSYQFAVLNSLLC